MKKASVLIIMVFFCAGILSSQSLVELSKKEKERRAKLKGKKIIVLTTAAVRNSKRRSAIIITETPNSRVAAISADLDKEQSSSTTRKIIPKTQGQDLNQDKKEAEEPQQLENKWKKAEEYVQLLTLKMNTLWQEFYSMDDMRSRDEIQRQISDTFQKLLQAQEDEKKLKTELDAIK
jgi:hypothetical protein